MVITSLRIGSSCRLFVCISTFCCFSQFARSQWTTANAAGNINNTNTGNVGILVTTPLVPLHVQGQIAATTYSGATLAGFVESWADNAIIWKNGNSNAGLRFGSANDLAAGGWSEKIRMTDAGSLGIGTSSPRTRLDIWGGLLMVTGADISGTFVGGAQGGIAYMGCNSLTNGLSISPTGNVGIGTTTVGTNKLAVEGTIAARKVIATSTIPFPDYVFDKTYSLTPLDSLASYIKINHHLPEIPCADSVARSGLDLGGNQEALLKKIEELTLYILQQNTDKKTQDLLLQSQEQKLNLQASELELLKSRMQKLEEQSKK